VTKPNWALVIALKESGGTVTATRLQRLLRGAGVEETLAPLTRRGYHFEQTKSGGLRLAAWPRRLFAGEIAHGLGTDVVGRRVEVHWRVPSTNDLARAEARRGREGTGVFTEEQTAGRGRFGRVWRAEKFSSLLFSVPLHSPRQAVAAEGLMLAGAVAVAEAVDETLGMRADIRWPNDVLVEGRKVSGVLVEGLAPAAGDRWLIAGVGVNCIFESPPPAGIHATAAALSDFTDKPVDRALLARAILRRLDWWWDILKAGESARLTERWRSLSGILGEFVTVESAGRRHRGRVVDLDAHFGLVLQMSGGPTRVFAPADATLVG